MPNKNVSLFKEQVHRFDYCCKMKTFPICITAPYFITAGNSATQTGASVHKAFHSTVYEGRSSFWLKQITHNNTLLTDQF